MQGKLTKYILIMVSQLFLFSCEYDDSPCGGERPRKGAFYYPQADTNIFPYQEGDSLYFRISDAQGVLEDSCLFIVSGKIRGNTVIGEAGTCTEDPRGETIDMVLWSKTWLTYPRLRYIAMKHSNMLQLQYRHFKFDLNATWMFNGGEPSYQTYDINHKTYPFVYMGCDEEYRNGFGCIDYPILFNRQSGIIYFKAYNSEVFTLLQ